MNRLLLLFIISILLICVNFYYFKNDNFEEFKDINDILEQSICDECSVVTGPVGPKGDRGFSSYSIAKSLSDDPTNFPSPSMWIHSLKGHVGPTGPVGPKGNKGDTGPAGNNAYNIAKSISKRPSDFPSRSMWVHSLKGEKGDQGPSDTAPSGTILAFFPDYEFDPSVSQPSEKDVTTITNIPSGWALCDGNQYFLNSYNNVIQYTSSSDVELSSVRRTPDLRGRFILSAGTNANDSSVSFNLNQIGGSKTHTLKEEEMPSHTHTLENAGIHNHNGNTEESNAVHTHNRIDNSSDGYTNNGIGVESGQLNNFTNSINQFVDPNIEISNYSQQEFQDNVKKYATLLEIAQSSNTVKKATNIGYGSAPHKHIIENGGDHKHQINSSGGNQPHENMPPYYSLVYIMKI